MSQIPLRLRRLVVRTPSRLSPALRWTALWGSIAALAGFFALALPAFPVLAFFPLAASAGLLLLTRSPLLFLGALTLSTGFYVTITVEIPPPVSIYFLMAAALLALWIVALRERIEGRARDRVVLWPGLVMLIVACLGALGWVVSSGNLTNALAEFRTSWWFVLGAVLRWAIGPSAAEEAFARRIGGNFTALNGELRALGGVGDAHGLGLLMAAPLPFLFALALGWRGGWRVVAIAAFGVCAVALVAADVRAGMAAAGLGLGVVLTLTFAARPLGSSRLLAAMVGALLCAGAVGGTIAYKSGSRDESSQRFGDILNPESDQSIQERQLLWRDALNDIDDAPFGHGIGTASSTGRKNQRFVTSASEDVGSSYLRIAYEFGLGWLVVFVVALVAILLRLVREALLAPDRQRALFAIGAAGTLASLGFQLNFESVYFEAGAILLGWLIVGMGLRSATLRPAPQSG